MTYGLSMGRDGYLYVGIGNNRDNSYIYCFDTKSETFTSLGNFRDALTDAVFRKGNSGKFHVGPYQDKDGAVWVASHPRERWEGASSGRLFRIDADQGMEDYGPTPGDQGVYFMIGDDRYEKLYLATRNSHFSVYDMASSQWQDKGKFTSKAPFISLWDAAGRLYMFGYDGEGDWSVGPATITRYDPQNDQLLTSRTAPPTLWVGAVTPDGETAYTTTYRYADLYRWRFDEWPKYEAEHLGQIDPRGREVFSNNLSLSTDRKILVLAGTIESPYNPFRGNLHGVWVYELETGRRWQIAELNEVISRSLGINSEQHLIYWTNANTLDRDGWIWIGIHTMPSGSNAVARLIGIKVSRQATDGAE